jgi:hypothetical protein
LLNSQEKAQKKIISCIFEFRYTHERYGEIFQQIKEKLKGKQTIYGVEK